MAMGKEGTRVFQPAFCLLFLLLGSQPAVARGAALLTLHYSEESEKVALPYDRTLAIMFDNVNTLDYRYSVSIAVRPPAPVPTPSVSISLPQRDRRGDCRDASEGADWLNKQFLARIAAFGDDELIEWGRAARAGIDSTWCSEVADALQRAIPSEGILGKAGVYEIASAELLPRLSAAGAGGALVITAEAVPFVTTFRFESGAFVPTRREMTEKEVGDHADKSGILGHMKKRTFIVEFEPPPGIIFTFGPYLSSLERQEFSRVLKKDSQTEYEIGLSEDSGETYGVAAFWNAILFPKAIVGLSWGVAYNLQNEPEQAVAGLLGVFWTPAYIRAPVLIQIGAAVGRQKLLAGGRHEGDPIGADTEIPTRLKTRVGVFAAMSFNVGRSR
jgi:hypothetical protein